MKHPATCIDSMWQLLQCSHPYNTVISSSLFTAGYYIKLFDSAIYNCLFALDIHEWLHYVILTLIVLFVFFCVCLVLITLYLLLFFSTFFNAHMQNCQTVLVDCISKGLKLMDYIIRNILFDFFSTIFITVYNLHWSHCFHWVLWVCDWLTALCILT